MAAVSVEPIAEVPDQVDRLVDAWPFKPYRWVRNAPAGGLQTLVLERIRGTLAAPHVGAWAARLDGALAGILLLQPLDWDSRVLGTSAARVELFLAGGRHRSRPAVDALLAAAIPEAQRRAIRHVSARVDAGDEAAAQGLERRGFVNVDALLTFEAAPAQLAAAPGAAGVVLRPASTADRAAVMEIAASSFRHGRFHSDPCLTEETANAVYRAWAAACCDGSAADGVIVAAIDGRVAGFVACRIPPGPAVHLHRATGTIPLIASAAGDRGRGVGAALVAAAAAWFHERNVVAVEIGTQLQNVEAARLYERCGFRLVAGALSFRLMIEP